MSAGHLRAAPFVALPPEHRRPSADSGAVIDGESREGNADEHVLVERARTDPDAFAELYRRYVGRIHAFALRRTGSREAAEDITSATFERALDRLDRYRWRPSGFGPWLFRIAANQVAEHHRQRARHSTEQAQLALSRHHRRGVDPVECDPAEREQLLAALETLSARHQQVLSLRYFADLTPGEAATAMGMTKGAFAVALHRARRSLARAMEGDGS